MGELREKTYELAEGYARTYVAEGLNFDALATINAQCALFGNIDAEIAEALAAKDARVAELEAALRKLAEAVRAERATTNAYGVPVTWGYDDARKAMHALAAEALGAPLVDEHAVSLPRCAACHGSGVQGDGGSCTNRGGEVEF